MENKEWDCEDSKTELETSFLDEREDDPPVRGTQLLSKIYQRCNVAIMNVPTMKKHSKSPNERMQRRRSCS